MDFKGFDELIKEMEQLGRRGNTVQNKALKTAALPILKEAKVRAPKRTGKGVKGLTVGRPRWKGDTKYVLIGIDRGDISEVFYMKFHEFGTSKMQARPYLGPAFEMKKKAKL